KRLGKPLHDGQRVFATWIGNVNHRNTGERLPFFRQRGATEDAARDPKLDRREYFCEPFDGRARVVLALFESVREDERIERRHELLERHALLAVTCPGVVRKHAERETRPIAPHLAELELAVRESEKIDEPLAHAADHGDVK